MDIIVVSVIGFSVLVAGTVIAPTVKMAMDIAPFMYTNTRCAGRAGALLDRKAYESLLAASSMKEVLALLEDSSYSYAAEHAGEARFSALLEKDLHDTYSWLVTVMPEKLAPVIEALRGRFEVNSLQEALNACARGAAPGDLPFIADHDLRLKVEGAADVPSLAAAVQGSRYEEAFAHDDPQVVASGLDRVHLSRVLDAIDACADAKAAAPFRHWWRRVIDLANVRLAARKARGGGDVVFVDGGFLPAEKLREVAEESQLREILEGSAYAEFLDEDPELSVYRFLRKEGGEANAKHPLKGGPVVRFLVDKDLEVRNLNVIVKLKQEGFAAEEIARHLVM